MSCGHSLSTPSSLPTLPTDRTGPVLDSPHVVIPSPPSRWARGSASGRGGRHHLATRCRTPCDTRCRRGPSSRPGSPAPRPARSPTGSSSRGATSSGLFGVAKVRAAALMKTFGAELVGNQRTLPRTKLPAAAAQEAPRPAAFRVEEERRARLVAELQQARLTGVRFKVARRDHEREAGGPARWGVGRAPGARRSLSRRGRGGDRK